MKNVPKADTYVARPIVKVADADNLERFSQENKPCQYCLRDEIDCECGDFDVCPDMGDK